MIEVGICSLKNATVPKWSTWCKSVKPAKTLRDTVITTLDIEHNTPLCALMVFGSELCEKVYPNLPLPVCFCVYPSIEKLLCHIPVRQLTNSPDETEILLCPLGGKNTLMVENSHNLTSTFVGLRFSAILRSASVHSQCKYGGSYLSKITAALLVRVVCFHSHVVFLAISPLTMNSAVKLKRSVNSVEGDPVVENRKVINLPQRASRL